MSRRYGLAALLAVALLGACTTVPESSQPQVVQPVGVQPPDVTVTGPAAGAEPRAIVQGFLEQNGSADPNHASAREYLTPEERGRWSDATVTILDRTQVRNIVFGRHQQGSGRVGTITVTGQEIGTIDEAGSYKPFLRGDGSGLGGVPFSQKIGLMRVNGEWRIEQAPQGLLISAEQFQAFRQYAVYFFDSDQQDLAPVPRYTQLVDPSDVVPWLVQGLAAQPPSGLATGLPQNGSNSVKATYPADPSQPITVEIPGASSLDRANLDRLAAQLAVTLQQVVQVDHQVEITDGGKPVRIPAMGSAAFLVGSMAGQFQPTPPSKQLFYVRKGAVFQEAGRRIPGKAGLGVYNLTSVALTTAPRSNALLVAGVHGPADDATLDLPNPKVPGALVATSVRGQLSRPSWAPGRREVWIGDGSDLKLVTGPRTAPTVALNVPQGRASGRVSAVRISPDGTRVALVLTTPGSSQIYVGNIVRGTNEVSVNDLQPISPQGVAVTDVAWNDQLKLFATGRDLTTGVSQVYEVQCDGSVWNSLGNLGLPGRAGTVTAASGSEAVVSSGDGLWQQQGNEWQSLLNGNNYGVSPVYLE
jgi:hypothetical protein